MPFHLITTNMTAQNAQQIDILIEDNQELPPEALEVDLPVVKKTKYKKEKIADPKKYYVKNADLMEAFHEAKQLGRLTDRLAKYLAMIAERYSYHSWFVAYSFREDMVASAIVNLVANWHKFNPEKSNNPFAYYTTATYRSFLSYLDAERKERDIRDELLIEAGANPSFNYQARHGNSGKTSDDTAFSVGGYDD